ncbi:MAG: catechol 2,3-dioxygenase-like lactoylglutathione lyase family enzyme [Hyphomicrobiaceae bacterium]|jgi:catechol 2,3-dioxygenase-like lactoylglutathione lyase family enzyme
MAADLDMSTPEDRARVPLEAQQGMIVSMRLHHLAFRTDDLEALATFYNKLFGWPEVRDNRPHSIWLGISEAADEAGEAVAMIEQRAPAEPPIAADSLELVAFAAAPAELQSLRERAALMGCLDGHTDHTQYLRDPEGRRLAVSTYSLAAKVG